MGDDPKSVEFYAANVNAWLNTKFEHDKSLLALSAGGIGLLITLLTTTGVKSIESLVLYIAALMAFISCLGALLWIFRRNARHLEGVVQGSETSDPLLVILDTVALAAFLLGVLLSALIGISTAVHSYQEKERKMAEEKSQTPQHTALRESVNGVANMAPSNVGIAKLSVEGISKLSPTNSAPAPAAAPATPSTPAGEKK